MDWKEQLAALGGGTSAPEPAQEQSAPVERRKRSGVVYSTDVDYIYQSDEEAEAETLPISHQPLRISVERKGRGGKTVTLVRGFVGSDEALQSLAKQLKQRLGLGGSSKDGEIVIQGDVRQRLLPLLRELGYAQAK